MAAASVGGKQNRDKLVLTAATVSMGCSMLAALGMGPAYNPVLALWGVVVYAVRNLQLMVTLVAALAASLVLDIAWCATWGPSVGGDGALVFGIVMTMFNFVVKAGLLFQVHHFHVELGGTYHFLLTASGDYDQIDVPRDQYAPPLGGDEEGMLAEGGP